MLLDKPIARDDIAIKHYFHDGPLPVTEETKEIFQEKKPD